MNIIFVLVAAILGILVGGIINALADDLPFTYRVKRPHYRHGMVRPRSAWLGLSAFLTGHRTSPAIVVLKHRNRHQPHAKRLTRRGKRLMHPHPYQGTPLRPTLSLWGKKLSWRYPLTEIATALLFAYLGFTYGLSALTFFWMGIVAALILITVIDLEHRLILFVVIIPACLYAVVGAALVGPQISERIIFRDYIVGGLLGFGIFFVMYLGGFLFNAIMGSWRGEAIEEVAFGYGDVLLATLSGFILGWQALIFAIFIAIFAGAAGALIFLAAQHFVKGKYEMFTALPYGQYIVFGTLVMMLWRAPIIDYLQQIY